LRPASRRQRRMRRPNRPWTGMTTSSRLNAPPDWTEPLVTPAADGDDVGWLITFSDLVLQLFAFVIVAAVCGAAASHAARSQTQNVTAAARIEARATVAGTVPSVEGALSNVAAARRSVDAATLDAAAP